MIGILIFMAAVAFALVFAAAALVFFVKAAYHLVRWALG